MPSIRKGIQKNIVFILNLNLFLWNFLNKFLSNKKTKFVARYKQKRVKKAENVTVCFMRHR